MLTVILSSRKKGNKDFNLMKMIQSFDKFTTEEEKKNSEFLIKFDEDDDSLESELKLIDLFQFRVRPFFWARNGGRSSLHEVQHYLYKFKNPNTTWVQIIADDFVFTRPNFVSDILSSDGNYTYIGTEDYMTDKCRGTAPCFSRKLLDACAGSFGPQPNSDGFATGIDRLMKEKYGINIGLNIDQYYYRLSCETSEKHDNFNTTTKKNCGIIYDLIAKNVYLNWRNDNVNKL